MSRVKNPVTWVQVGTLAATKPLYLAESQFFSFPQLLEEVSVVSNIHEWLPHKYVFYTPSGSGHNRYPKFDSTKYFILHKSGGGDTQIEGRNVTHFKGAKWFGKRFRNSQVSSSQASPCLCAAPLRDFETNIPHQLNPPIYLEG